MNILNFAWNTFIDIAQKDFDKVRLILDEHLTYPILSFDEAGYVVKIPLPKRLRSDLYTLHGEYYETNVEGWSNLWRTFKASLYHAAIHIAYSNFEVYKSWAKGKDTKAAIFCVTLLEDLHATYRAAKNHPGILYDIAYSNYLSALRLNQHMLLYDEPLRYATVLLLAAWGLENSMRSLTPLDVEAIKTTKKLRELVLEAVESGEQNKLIEGAQLMYSALYRRGSLTEIPSFPYTESHGRTNVFKGSSIDESQELLRRSFSSLGLKAEELRDEKLENLQEFEAAEVKINKLKERVEKIIAATRLEDLVVPRGDYAMFLRIRANLAGVIANIRNQLRLLKTAEDEVSGDESGQLDTQTAIQVVASRSLRNDVFTRDEKVLKREAWAILLDASKSIGSTAPEVRKLAVCLAEVAKDLFSERNLWGLFAFNNNFLVLKDFNEPYSMDVKARIGGLLQGGSTFLPDAISVCSKALTSLPVEPRILMVISDGYPVGYTGIERELVFKIRKTSRSGVLLLGIGITNPSIRGFFTVNCDLMEPYQMMKFFVRAYFELSSLF
ncbi:MAG: hypothetical protein QXN08_04380 [Nitrososphaerales archaeon]